MVQKLADCGSNYSTANRPGPMQKVQVGLGWRTKPVPLSLILGRSQVHYPRNGLHPLTQPSAAKYESALTHRQAVFAVLIPSATGWLWVGEGVGVACGPS
jgi:hypothetical protein